MHPVEVGLSFSLAREENKFYNCLDELKNPRKWTKKTTTESREPWIIMLLSLSLDSS